MSKVFSLWALPALLVGQVLALDDSSCTAGNPCCQEHRACDVAGAGVTVSPDSCNGYEACLEIGRYSGTASVGPGSCVSPPDERNACAWASRDGGEFSVAGSSCIGQYTCSSAARKGEASVLGNSCIGEKSCQNIAYDKEADIEIQKDSCHGDYACAEAARSGNSTVGVGSCTGDYACKDMARFGKSTIASGSCDGRSACQNTGYDSDGDFESSTNSCKGPWACYEAGRSGSVLISPDSCIASDPDDANVKNVCLGVARYGTGDFQNSKGTCLGREACTNCARAGTAVLQKDSCVGMKACQNAAINEGGNFEAGLLACQGPSSCYEAGKSGYANVAPKSCVAGDANDANVKNACAYAGCDATGNFTNSEGSCFGAYSCQQAGRKGKVLLESDTCVGWGACQYSAYEESGVFEAKTNSCKGPYACHDAGKSGTAEVASDSCISDDPDDSSVKQACKNVARDGGTFTNSEGSCLGTSACESSGSLGTSDVDQGACVGKQACQNSAYGSDGSFEAKMNSCKGPTACYEAGRDGSAVVASASCISDDPQDASVVNACNGVGRDSTGDFKNTEGSCIGNHACANCGRGGSCDVEKDSCLGLSACQSAAYSAGGVFKVDEKACLGPWACLETGRFGTANVAPNSCIAEDANDANVKHVCSYAARDSTGKFTNAEATCLGAYACHHTGRGGKAVLETDTCIGLSSCQSAAYAEYGDFQPKSGSCKGPWACASAGRNGTAAIAMDSCIADDPSEDGKNACSNVAHDFGGSFANDEKSCLGRYACDSAARAGTAQIAKDSCIGPSACQSVAYEKDGSFSNEMGSCNGQYACSSGGRKGLAHVAEESCIGDSSCSSTGYYGRSDINKDACKGRNACSSSAYGESGRFEAKPNSCYGPWACNDAGRDGTAVIASDSCIADDPDDGEVKSACNSVAREKNAQFTNAEGSCLGTYSCGSTARWGNAAIAKRACVGRSACQNAGHDGDGSFTASEDSCSGPWACNDAGRSGSAIMGSGSCQTVNATDVDDKGACSGAGYHGEFSVDGNGCRGPYACSGAAREGGKASVGTASCIGSRSCVSLGKYENGEASVGGASCVGDYSCGDGGMHGSFATGDRSCIGEQACKNSGRELGSTFTVGSDSCVNGDEVAENCRTVRSCEQAGRFGDVEFGNRSCIGAESCKEAGYEGIVKVGDDSCLGPQACSGIGKHGGEVEVGDRSCKEPHSCRAIGLYPVESVTRERGKLRIGNDACNCEGCCTCLKAGDIVPDGMCNALGDGPENCCLNEVDRNPYGPLRVSNLCVEEENVCKKATVWGDPHITTFSQLKYDCMGQGEFILAKSQREDDPLEIRGLFVDPEFTGQADPWENDRSAQTVTRGVAFKVDEDIPIIRILTDDLKPDTCNFYYSVGDEDVTLDYLLNTLSTSRPDLTISSNLSRNTPNIRFEFGDYDADIHVTVGPTEKWGCMINLSTCLKPKYHGDVLGVFGTNNGYKDDDWTTQDGTQLPIPTDPSTTQGRAMASAYCIDNWCVRDIEDSFFATDTYNYFSRCDANPYGHQVDVEKVTELLEKIKANCEAAGEYNIPSDVLYDAALANHLTDPDAVECPVDAVAEALWNKAIAEMNCELSPTDSPTLGPTEANTFAATVEPTTAPTTAPSSSPSTGPTSRPTNPTQGTVGIDLTDPPTSGPTSGPSVGPTAGVTIEPTTGPTTAPTTPLDTESSDVKGDPHFRTWVGEHFEYHGQCDLVLMKDDSFADGLGLQVQIRTKLIRFWSYVRSAAIIIGDDILEVEGSAEEIERDLLYWYNLEERGEMATLGGFPITAKRPSSKKQFFVIDLSSKYPGQSIEISTFKEFVRVQYKNGSAESVGNMTGMMGNFKTGETLGRDGRIIDDFTEYGAEWQVLPADNMLFHNVEQPQFPRGCIIPEDPRGERRRRLAESSITEEAAEKACSTLKDPMDRKDCVYDILATQDLEMVGAF